MISWTIEEGVKECFNFIQVTFGALRRMVREDSRCPFSCGEDLVEEFEEETCEVGAQHVLPGQVPGAVPGH